MGSYKLAPINGLRGIAILMVLYQHVFAFPIAKILNFTAVITQGWIGVNLFFILSGFVLYLPYITGTKEMRDRADLLKFYKNRFRRLYPLYIFILLISLIFLHHLSFEAIISFFKSLLCISVFIDPNFFPKLNGTFWSLEVEIQFSLIFPALLVIIRKYGIFKLLIFAVVFALLSRIVGVLNASQFKSGGVNFFTSSLFGHIDDFIAGMTIAHLYKESSKYSVIPKYPLFLVSLILLLISCVLIDLQPFKLFPAFQNLLVSIGFSGILYSAITKDDVWSNFLSLKWLQLMGAMCFSLYSWHILFIGEPIVPYFHNVPGYFIYFTTLFLISVFTYRYIEFGKEKSLSKLFLLS